MTIREFKFLRKDSPNLAVENWPVVECQSRDNLKLGTGEV